MIPKIKNRIALTIIGIALAAVVAGLVLDSIIPENMLASILLYAGLTVGQLFGLILLIQNSTLMNTVYWRIIKFCLAIAIIGVLFKIQHWPGSGIILVVSFAAIVITYTFRFFTKARKRRLDILKFLYVTTTYTCSLLMVHHLIPPDVMTIAHALFWITLIDFVVTGYIQKTLLGK